MSCRVVSCPVLSCPVLSCPVLSCPVLSCPVLSCRVVSCRVVSCRVVSCRVVSCRVVSCRVVSCRVVSCRDVSCRVVSCRVVSCRVVSCRVLSFRVVSCRVVSCRVVSCRVVPCRAVPCRAVPCRVVSCRVVPCRVVSCCVVLCCVVLCCVVLCCVVSCRVVLCHVWLSVMLLLQKDKPSLFWALHRTFGRKFYVAGVWRFLTDALSFLGPFLLGQLIGVVSGDAPVIQVRVHVRLCVLRVRGWAPERASACMCAGLLPSVQDRCNCRAQSPPPDLYSSPSQSQRQEGSQVSEGEKGGRHVQEPLYRPPNPDPIPIPGLRCCGARGMSSVVCIPMCLC